MFAKHTIMLRKNDLRTMVVLALLGCAALSGCAAKAKNDLLPGLVVWLAGASLAGSSSPGPRPPTIPGIYGADVLKAESSYTNADFDRVRENYMFFAHNSVGGNIMNGIGALRNGTDDRYRVNDCFSDNWNEVSGWCTGGGISHNGVGTNFQPLGKIEDFRLQMTHQDEDGGTLGNHVDVAMMKICYVDIDETTNVATLFAAYRAEMESLEALFPGTIFVYTTVPLWYRSNALKASNIVHNNYNALVREYVRSTGKPLYDIADIESVDANDQPCSFTDSGKEYRALCGDDEYTGWRSQEAHLNPAGEVRAAKALIFMLADLLKRRP